MFTWRLNLMQNLYFGLYMLVVAVLASIIASQSIITGTFSILQQSLSSGCFPLVKVVHTSAKYQGQVYMPEANYLFMLACVGITLGFRTTTNIGNAFGNIPKSTYSFSLYYWVFSISLITSHYLFFNFYYIKI